MSYNNPKNLSLGEEEYLMKFLITFLALAGLVSCSASKSTKDANSAIAGIELADTEEFSESALAPIDPSDMIADNIESFDTEEAPLNFGAEAMANNAGSAPVIDGFGETRSYTVQKNETLMLIAFKIYGDYARWREIAQMNSATLNGGTSVTEGMNLQYVAPQTEFVWNPEGNPYLIKTGDTLGTISQDVYDTTARWRNIWDNNRPLIKDPNKIFAGFTIYTPILEDGRDVATDSWQ